MEMNYPGNQKSTPAKKPASPEKPKFEKVVTGDVTVQKRTLGVKIKEFAFGSADAPGIFEHVFREVVVDAFRNLVFEAGMTTLERSVFGENGGSSLQRQALRTVASGASQVAYNRIAGQPSAQMKSTTLRPQTQPQYVRNQLSHSERRAHDFSGILFASRPEAMEVLRRMVDAIERYDTCSVSDMYQMVGLDADFTDETWGWDNLSGAGIRRDGRRGGYVLNLPRPEPLP